MRTIPHAIYNILQYMQFIRHNTFYPGYPIQVAPAHTCVKESCARGFKHKCRGGRGCCAAYRDCPWRPKIPATGGGCPAGATGEDGDCWREGVGRSSSSGVAADAGSILGAEGWVGLARGPGCLSGPRGARGAVGGASVKQAVMPLEVARLLGGSELPGVAAVPVGSAAAPGVPETHDVESEGAPAGPIPRRAVKGGAHRRRCSIQDTSRRFKECCCRTQRLVAVTLQVCA